MNKLFYCGLFLFINALVFSNDSRIITGSSVEVIDNEDTNIVMLEEEINITLFKDYYEVDVTFDFYNEGSAEDVLLGFPVEAHFQDYPAAREEAKPIEFRSYINGNLLTEYTTKEKETVSNWYVTNTTWFLREVTFPANSHTYSRVIYRMKYSYAGFSAWAGYIFGTGRSWKGSIGKMTINISHGDDILVRGVGIGRRMTSDGWSERPSVFSWEANGRYKYVLEDIKPMLDEDIGVSITGFDINQNYMPSFGGPYDDWSWSENLVYEDFTDIMLLTRNQALFLIAGLYAKHGIDIKDTFLEKGFLISDFYAKNPDFLDVGFNEIEKKNLEYLLNLEKMITLSENYQPAAPLLSENNILAEPEFSNEDDNSEKSSGFHNWNYLIIIALAASICVIMLIRHKQRNK